MFFVNVVNEEKKEAKIARCGKIAERKSKDSFVPQHSVSNNNNRV